MPFGYSPIPSVGPDWRNPFAYELAADMMTPIIMAITKSRMLYHSYLT